MTLIYLIAGEPSGDLLGGRLMRALARNGIEFTGIGGETMTEQGLKSLFPMAELSIMGLAEILPHVPRLWRRINQTVEDILQKRPDVVVTIDAPGFCHRVLRRVRARDPSIKLIHYVAPTVWAWKPGRAAKIARFLDHLLALLPFEPPYFEKVGLPCTFVGHPLVEDQAAGDAERFRANYHVPSGATVICLLPGSRQGEVSRLLPLCREVALGLYEKRRDLFFAIPTVPHLVATLRDELKDFSVPHAIVEGSGNKADALAAARAALAASGTVALELALAGLPAAICYRVSPVTAFLAKRLVSIPYASLPNLILRQEIMPEFLQERATANLIVPAMEALLGDTPERQRQIEAAPELARRLKPDGMTPSEKAAEIVMACTKS